MNNTTLGNSFSLLLKNDLLVICSMVIRVPIIIYILQVIISKGWISSEFYTFKKAVFELVTCFHDTLAVFGYFFPDMYLSNIKSFLLGFALTGRPYILTLICVECYLATVKPVVYLQFKPLRYKVLLSGIIWVLTLVSCLSSVFVSLGFYYIVIAQMTTCYVIQLYCCVCTLVVLKQPGPGEGIRQGKGPSNKKLKAFWIILVITISVITTYGSLIIVIILRDFMNVQLFTVVVNVCYACTFSAGTAHTFLFLQRAGKLPCATWP